MASAPLGHQRYSIHSSTFPPTPSDYLPLSPTHLPQILSTNAVPNILSLFTGHSLSSHFSFFKLVNFRRRPSRFTFCRVDSLDFEGVKGDFDEVGEGEEGEFSELNFFELDEEARRAARKYSISLSQEVSLEDETYEEEGESLQRQRTLSIHIPDHLLPKVAIVGRPNVGKSALFNRLVGENMAIVVDEPGVTRDRHYGRSFWGDREFSVIDTGGVMTFSRSHDDVMKELDITTTVGMEGIPLALREAAVARMPSMIEKQAASAVEEASVIIFLVDGQTGLTVVDEEIADWLRKNYSMKPIILAVNKCESPRKGLMQASEFWSLGFTPLPISAISGTGTGDLLELVCSELQTIEMA